MWYTPGGGIWEYACRDCFARERVERGRYTAAAELARDADGIWQRVSSGWTADQPVPGPGAFHMFTITPRIVDRPDGSTLPVYATATWRLVQTEPDAYHLFARQPSAKWWDFRFVERDSGRALTRAREMLPYLPMPRWPDRRPHDLGVA